MKCKEVTMEGRVKFDLFQVTLNLAWSLLEIVSYVHVNQLEVQSSSCPFTFPQVMHRDYSLNSYKLNSVSAHFLGEPVTLYALLFTNF